MLKFFRERTFADSAQIKVRELTQKLEKTQEELELLRDQADSRYRRQRRDKQSALHSLSFSRSARRRTLQRLNAVL